MTLQASGTPISLLQIQNEFSPTGGTGDNDPKISLSEYYRNGSIIASDSYF